MTSALKDKVQAAAGKDVYQQAQQIIWDYIAHSGQVYDHVKVVGNEGERRLERDDDAIEAHVNDFDTVGVDGQRLQPYDIVKLYEVCGGNSERPQSDVLTLMHAIVAMQSTKSFSVSSDFLISQIRSGQVINDGTMKAFLQEADKHIDGFSSTGHKFDESKLAIAPEAYQCFL